MSSVVLNLATYVVMAAGVATVAAVAADHSVVTAATDALGLGAGGFFSGLLPFGDRAPSSGLFVVVVLCLCSCALTVFQMLGHLTHYVNPTQQRYVLRIMMMVPVYAIDSLLGFVIPGEAAWFALVRDTYEAYVLYNFYQLLLALNGGEAGTVKAWKLAHGATGGTMAHLFPTNFVYGPFPLDMATLRRWRFLLVQYMVLSPLVTVATFVLSVEGLFDDETWSLANAHVYLMCLKSVSVTFAFTALLYFYLACKHTPTLHARHPTSKFISVKFVVFMGFWQSVVIAGLGAFDLLPDSLRPFLLTWHRHKASDADVEMALENLLTVGEMFITAVMHHFVFSYTEFVEASGNGKTKDGSFWSNVAHAFSVSDVADDAASTLAEQRKKKQ